MFSLMLRKTLAMFVQPSEIEQISSVLIRCCQGASKVLIADLSPVVCHDLISDLAMKHKVMVRDHHKPDTGSELYDDVYELIRARPLVDALCVTRKNALACAQLIDIGCIGDKDVIIAHADGDGLFAALRAVGLTYVDLVEDAMRLDGPSYAAKLHLFSDIGQLFVRSTAVLQREDARGHQEAYQLFVDMLVGREAEKRLNVMALNHDVVVRDTLDVLDSMRISTVYDRRWAVLDVSNVSDKFDSHILQATAVDLNADVLVVISTKGAIASRLSTKQVIFTALHDGIDLRETVAEIPGRGPQHGIISNEPFRLHLSRELAVQLLPALFKE